MTDSWTWKDSLNIIIGIVTAFLTAYLYEKAVSKRNQIRLRSTYIFLESSDCKFDWQHWNIINGKISDNPIQAFMTLIYIGDKSFSFKWKEPGSDKIKGDGFMFWDDLTHGKMSFYSLESSDYNYRNIFHRKIIHQEKKYDAIFVNADDQKTRYVMLRQINSTS